MVTQEERGEPRLHTDTQMQLPIVLLPVTRDKKEMKGEEERGVEK